MVEKVSEKEIERISQDGREIIKDFLIEEFPLTIFLNGKELVTLLCTPENLQALVIGFLHGEGIVKTPEDVISWQLDEEKGVAQIKTQKVDTLAERLYEKRLIPTGCGKGTIFFNALDTLGRKAVESSLQVKVESIHNLLKNLLNSSRLFQLTGAVHSVALCSEEEIIVLSEDVARHNAIDKVIGYCLLNNISPKDKIIVVTGRISSEMLSKVAKLEIPVLVSKSAPTRLAVDMAEKLGITLIGFVRGRRMNIYTRGDRINQNFKK